MTEKCDVYSFGIVALETIMGKHPGELISQLSTPFAQNILLKDVLDSRICVPFFRKDIQSVVLVITLALACLRSTPKSRPSMQQVAQELSDSKPPLHVSLHEISIQQLMTKEIYTLSNIKA